ncbi:MAG: hypothetical protein HND58_17310 [Planctomycetota bacterium]|nr:MAG: hypothetical protein HND58_17310 [Planctomycetota bacterium]
MKSTFRVMMLVLTALLGATAISLASAQPAGAGAEAAGQPESAIQGVRFGYVDLYIDSGEVPMAVYQVELRATAGDIRIVGVEGGDSAAFSEPPRYDPVALTRGERIVLGEFSTGSALPSGRTRIARVHLRIDGPPPVLELTLATAGDSAAAPINATASFTTSFQTQDGSTP